MEDTICAISTSLGVGAISIIRLSGSDAIKIVNSIFSYDITSCDTHVIKYGYIKDNEEVIDEVLLMIMRAPKTYTKEDIVEINCHGGYNTTNRILELLLRKGCRLAEPGEFTKRAFLNGRINLLESEAVNELISAKTDAKRKMSLNQLGGNLTKKIESIREQLIALMANIEVNIDYPEYTDNLVITENLLKEKLREITLKLDKLVEGTKIGKIVSNGINVAIIGKPNVGKSSVLNHLLDEEKAIVTDVAGTTRDLVEGVISLNGIEVKLIDTAGIHETDDLVEKIGVEKSVNLISEADVVLLVLDGSRPLDSEDRQLLEKSKRENTIIFINKNDQHQYLNLEGYGNIVYGNTVTPDGLDDLKEKLLDMFNINDINKDLTYLSNARQIDLVNKANEALKTANNSLLSGVPIDMIESDLKRCFEFLGQIIGDTYEEAVIDRLFKDFCVGK
ncbi:MAG: tRNA uridine-5-carboxymethylaminomethyl(34) synthesis GTPase MnmE [Firmicutes bacterium]|nr:tRNA uridine-5-carboxymethylaminomethyl(34) synthesis GTPase MnmE [Bacillota bacterium]